MKRWRVEIKIMAEILPSSMDLQNLISYENSFFLEFIETCAKHQKMTQLGSRTQLIQIYITTN